MQTERDAAVENLPQQFCAVSREHRIGARAVLVDQLRPFVELAVKGRVSDTKRREMPEARADMQAVGSWQTPNHEILAAIQPVLMVAMSDAASAALSSTFMSTPPTDSRRCKGKKRRGTCALLFVFAVPFRTIRGSREP
jgi:hypothetical protein